MGAVALSLLFAHRLVERPSMARALTLGSVLGLGCLTKQTFVFLVFIPLVWVLRRLGRQSTSMVAITLGTAILISGPWWMLNAFDQITYGAHSLANHSGGGLLDHLLYYPKVLVFLGLGPSLALAAALAARIVRDQPDRRGWLFGLVWLFGGLLVLTLIPKKYPRLLAPLTPAIAIWIAILWVRSTRSKTTLTLLGVGAVANLWLASSNPKFSIKTTNSVDAGCPQIWLRQPVPDDHGLATVQRILADKPPGAIFVAKDYEIPCHIQTTHRWSHHLAPYLRRAGLERRVHTDASQPHDFVVRVGPDEGPISIWKQSVHLDIRDRLSP